MTKSLTLHSQTKLSNTSFVRKITISNYCLCRTTLDSLLKLDSSLLTIEVEEMDLGKKCIAIDSRFENGKGYYSDKVQGIIFQKDQTTNAISKLRLTKDFVGNLPDGTPVDLKNLTLKDVLKFYPYLNDKWNSRGCSDYWKFSNDTLSFYVKIDTTKKPQFPIDEMFYLDKPIEAIDLGISCYSLLDRQETNIIFKESKQTKKRLNKKNYSSQH